MGKHAEFLGYARRNIIKLQETRINNIAVHLAVSCLVYCSTWAYSHFLDIYMAVHLLASDQIQRSLSPERISKPKVNKAHEGLPINRIDNSYGWLVFLGVGTLGLVGSRGFPKMTHPYFICTMNQKAKKSWQSTMTRETKTPRSAGDFSVLSVDCMTHGSRLQWPSSGSVTRLLGRPQQARHSCGRTRSHLPRLPRGPQIAVPDLVHKGVPFARPASLLMSHS